MFSAAVEDEGRLDLEEDALPETEQQQPLYERVGGHC